ncbi:MAG TPA: O-antigen ligase family protein [Acidobacteriaceae bacterium]|nr:O-antigen ligase family protein [Acidobacteriaceae bacterium]
MFGTGLGHYIPIVVYLGFWVMSIVSLVKQPLWGFYFMLPFLPYRTLRDRIIDYPLGAYMLTILLLCVIAGALLRGKRLPKTKMYAIWLIFAIYLYISLWIGAALKGAPLPIWQNAANFATWKAYMIIPMVFVAAGLVIEDRKSIKMTILITAIALALIDRSCILESLTRSWSSFSENKRTDSPLAYGPNQAAAFLVQFAMFFWGLTQFVKRIKFKVIGYALVAATLFAMMYMFSRAGYAAALFAVLLLGLLKDRKMLLVFAAFLLTWQTLVPTAVRERVKMTDENGQLDTSAQERIDLWENAREAIVESPIVGQGFATFQLGEHVDNLKDTHNYYVKVIVETGIVGLGIFLFLLQQMAATSYRLFKRASDPLYRGLGLGLLLATSACLVGNFFGDRWTYLEIMGLLWVQFAAAVRALELSAAESFAPPVKTEPAAVANPYLLYR